MFRGGKAAFAAEDQMAGNRTEVTNEVIFETLRSIQGTLARHSDDLREIKERLGNIETQIGGLAMQYAHLSNRLDRLETRLDHIERRLDLVEG
jgi:tetrahydromethanopterin S-methyltransferase subunit G